jgi:hypothetical protein
MSIMDYGRKEVKKPDDIDVKIESLLIFSFIFDMNMESTRPATSGNEWYYIPVMVRYYVMLFFIVILFSGCNLFDPDEPLNYNDRVIIKYFPIGKDTIEWYHYSLITGFSPGFIELKNQYGRKIICKSSYISDIQLQSDTLLLRTLKNHFFVLDTGKVEGLTIIVDTTAKSVYLKEYIITDQRD